MMLEIPILFEDADTVIVNKPVGVVVNRSGTVVAETVQDWVQEQKWMSPLALKGGGTFAQRSGICHRLDKETSGCLVIAKNQRALNYYLGLFKERKLVKTYLALVHGEVLPRNGELSLPIKRSVFDREKWQVHYGGKRAVTAWTVAKYLNLKGYEHWRDRLTLLSLNLKTGRTHQIRVHLSFLGWPIFSDDKYLSQKYALADRKLLSHHFLHASSIEVVSFAGETVKVEAPLPRDCEIFLTSLE